MLSVGEWVFGGSKSAKTKKKFFFGGSKVSALVKKKIGPLAPGVGFPAQVECRADFRVWPKIALGGFFGRSCVKIKRTLKSTTELTRRAMNLIFFLNEAQ